MYVCMYVCINVCMHVQESYLIFELFRIIRKAMLFMIWKQSRNEDDQKKYCEAKKDAKIVYVYGSESSRGSGAG